MLLIIYFQDIFCMKINSITIKSYKLCSILSSHENLYTFYSAFSFFSIFIVLFVCFRGAFSDTIEIRRFGIYTYHNIEPRWAGRNLQKGKWMITGNKNRTLEQYLKELRKSCNYSQEFVASHLNITRQTYSHYETGRITPPVNSLYNLAKLYGIPVENLLNLVVTYNINMDFARTVQPTNMNCPDEIEAFVEYTNDPQIRNKLKYLNRDERLLLYYFQLLDLRDKEDILDFMKLKSHKRPHVPDEKRD